MDWRPREYNAPPDTVCNWILHDHKDRHAIDVVDVKQAAETGYSLQIHCDGGYKGGVGAAAFVVHAIEVDSGSIHRVGYAGRFIAGAKSPFHTELTALDMALGFVQQAFA